MSGRPSPATALFAAAVAVALIVAAALLDTRGFAVRTPDGGYESDIAHYVYWTRLVTLGGIQSAYGGAWPETYAVYPPVTLYGYQAVGAAYRALVDPEFDLGRALASRWLRRAIKVAALVWHLLTAAAVYLLVRRAAAPSGGQRGAALAGLAGALYVANPAALFDAAHWAQPDGAHSLFTVLAVGWLNGPRRARREPGHLLWSWAATALAALAKPQAWAIVPLLALASWRQRRRGRLAAAGAVAAATAALVLAPFLLTGRLRELLSLPGTIASVMPRVTANAHNLWWLALAQRGLPPAFVDDTAPLLGPLTYRSVAALLVGAQLALVYWLFWSRRVALAEAAALATLGWFLLTTQAHENHLFLVLPLLALAWPERRGLLLAYVLLSATVLLNMALHDQLLLEALGRGLDDGLVRRLRLANAALNLACFAAWSIGAAMRQPAGASRRVPAAESPEAPAPAALPARRRPASSFEGPSR